MDQITPYLINLSDKLDKAGNIKCADQVDSLIQSGSMDKVAQYVGVIGYVLKQNRAMDNCVRKKRAASSDAMQTIVLGCLQEYQDGQEYGNNEWTAKYAQVIEQAPEQFEGLHVDFLQEIAESNDIQQHIDAVKSVHQLLQDNDIKDEFFDHVVTSANHLDDFFKEGDADHRSFRFAAPQSPRSGFWNRMFAPSWTRRGKDKDTQYEMDSIIESLSGISDNIQNLRTIVYKLRHEARRIPNEAVRKEINKLSENNWESNRVIMDNLSDYFRQNQQTSLGDSWSRLEFFGEKINDKIGQIQSDMRNLRQREAITGSSGAASSADEYGDLERALSKLYYNPLDRKAIYYSQKLHGRLMDALHARPTSQDPDFNQWSQEYEPREELDPMGGLEQEPGSNIDPGATSQPAPSIIEPFITAINETAAENPELNAISVFIKLLDKLVTSNVGLEGIQEFGKLRNELNNLDTSNEFADPISPVNTPANVPAETGTDNEYANAGDVFDPSVRPERFKPPKPVGPYEVYDKSVRNIYEAMLRSKILTKLAEESNTIDPQLSELLQEYLQNYSENEEKIPSFPESSSILKEEATLPMKVTWNKAGNVLVNT